MLYNLHTLSLYTTHRGHESRLHTLS